MPSFYIDRWRHVWVDIQMRFELRKRPSWSSKLWNIGWSLTLIMPEKWTYWLHSMRSYPDYLSKQSWQVSSSYQLLKKMMWIFRNYIYTFDIDLVWSMLHTTPKFIQRRSKNKSILDFESKSWMEIFGIQQTARPELYL